MPLSEVIDLEAIDEDEDDAASTEDHEPEGEPPGDGDNEPGFDEPVEVEP